MCFFYILLESLVICMIWYEVVDVFLIILPVALHIFISGSGLYLNFYCGYQLGFGD